MYVLCAKVTLSDGWAIVAFVRLATILTVMAVFVIDALRA